MRSGVRAVGALLVLGGAAAAALRFAFGLGATTNLSDGFPWGLWVGFDVLVGVATAAGGFTVAFLAHILGREAYRPVARAAVLTAFLGYVLVGVALLVDVGRPWNMWRPLVHWNPRSVMFEVAWCVMLYTNVLAAEFAPEILGALGLRRWGERIHRAMPVLAGAGVLLSTLHQSSLGTVYLIVPGRLHPYWYTPLLPLLFLVSAVKCGLAMAILEASLSHARLGAAYEGAVLRRLGRGLLALVGATLALQVGDLWARDVAFDASTYEGRLLLLEVVLGGLLPFAVLLGPRRETPPRLLLAAVLSVVGVLLHRMNVAVTGLEGALGGAYVPHPAEMLVTLGLVAAGVGLFAFLARFTEIVRPDYRPPVPLLDRLSGATLAAVAAVAALALALERGPAPAAARPVEARGSLPDAARLAPDLVLSWAVATSFPHAAHPFACSDCHADSWPVLAGAPPGERGGHGLDGCASCHDGRRAFGVEAEAHCDRCHAPYVHFDPAGPACASCHGGGPAPGRTAARALFPHALHAARASDCRACHADGRDRPPWEGLTMADLRAGAACGACHDGRAAFALDSCGECHVR